MEEANKWIENMQKLTNSFYTGQNGVITHNDTQYKYLYCQHLARLQNRGKPKVQKTCRRRNIGLVPNFSCPSRIRIHRLQDRSIRMRYFALHNHPLKVEYLKYHQFPKSLRRHIIAKLAMGIKPRRVLSDERPLKWSGPYRDSLTMKYEKRDLLTSRYKLKT